MSLQKEGEFTLHSRAILEMEQYIRETYPDTMKICDICHGLLIQVPCVLGAACGSGSLWAGGSFLAGSKRAHACTVPPAPALHSSPRAR